MGNQASRRSVSNKGSANNTHSTVVKATKTLGKSLELWLMEAVGIGVSLHSNSIDSRLMTRQECCHSIGGVGDKRVN